MFNNGWKNWNLPAKLDLFIIGFVDDAALLPKMGFNRHIPLKVRYGPPQYNDKGLVHFATHQHGKHLEDFISSLRDNTHLGQALWMEMDKYQMLLGTQEHFLTLDSRDFKYGEKR